MGPVTGHRRKSRTRTKPRATTARVTVNAAFLQEIKEVNEQLWQLLHEIEVRCAHPSSVRLHPGGLVRLLERLQRQLRSHFALENRLGYFEAPLKVTPHLAEQADALRAEHAALYGQLVRIVDRAKALWRGHRFSELLNYVPVRFNAFHDQLKQHESREDDLIVNVFAENQQLFERLQLRRDVDVVDWVVQSLPRYRLDDGFSQRVWREIEARQADL